MEAIFLVRGAGGPQLKRNPLGGTPMLRMSLLQSCYHLATLALLAACVVPQTTSQQPPTGGRRLSVESVPLTQTQAIWEAVLRSLAAHHGPTEADVVRQSAADIGHPIDSAGERRPSIVLVASRGRLQKDSAWLNSLVSRQLVTGVCYETRLEQCNDTVLTTYRTLHPPDRRGDTISVRLDEEGRNPAECRKHQSFVGGWKRIFLLVKQEGQWKVVGADRYGEASWSGTCGQPPPEIQERMREDSLVRESVSPVAGTYRFTVVLPTGDSVIVYSRTERKPMGGIWGWKQEDASRDDLPLSGYELMAVCGLDKRALPSRYVTTDSTTVCYHAVSVQPIVQTPDSSVWRGDPMAEGAAWILLKDAPVAQTLYAALNDSLRDPNAFYMPGRWTVYADGRVRFEWVVKDAGAILAVIRGERMSSATLSGHSH